MTRVLALGLFLLLASIHGVARGSPSTSAKVDPKAMEHWQDLRFGMFIHWGPVSLRGTEIGWSRGAQVPVDEYDQLYTQFNPVEFDADAWVKTAVDAGMKYLVITSKHHDGFSLWPSAYTDYDIAATPFNRDILKELAAACKKQGIMFCTYHSICDWYHPDYPLGSPGGKSKKTDHNMPRYFEYIKNQTEELLVNYGPIGVMWFDGQWEKPWTNQYGDQLYDHVRSIQPDLIVNNRVGKGRAGAAGTSKQTMLNPGDFDTPEQRVGSFSIERPWETCMTICRQWAWKPNDKMKSLEECIQTLVTTVGGNGNLLFNVGPMPDGRIEPRQVERLKEMGEWLKEHGESIYGTRGGPFMPGDWGVSTHKDRSIYLHILNFDADTVTLPPMDVEIVSAKLISGGDVAFTQSEDAITVTVERERQQVIDTIVELTLDIPARDIRPINTAVLSVRSEIQ